MDGDTAREYYRALDSHAYSDLADLLDPDFTHYRPDRTLEGRETFVRFMREQRPMKDTTHEVRAIYETDDGVTVRGRLCDSDGEALFEFVDIHECERVGEIAAIHTYTR